MKRKLLVSMIGILAASTALADSAKDSRDSRDSRDAKAKSYSLSDLKALVAQKAYEEAVEHLGDLAPSERNAEWLDVAATAAAGFVAQLPVEQIVYGIEAVERAYPQVLTSAKYTKPRGELGLRGYARFLDRAGGGGLEQAMRFLDGEPANAGLALGMGKVVLRAFSSKYAAAPFFGRAVAGKAPGACKDEDLKTALISALGLPSDYEGAVAARSIADACWSEQKKTIVEQFDEAAGSGGGYVRANTCEILKAKKALTAKQARICAGDKDD